MPRWINVANLLTLLRLFLAPFVIQAILTGHHTRALATFAAAGATDALDGAAARWLGGVTQVGAYLDPIADKCLLSGVYVALAYAHIVPWWLVAIIFGRDVYILLGVCLIIRLTPVRRFAPSVWGKASTFLQILTAVAWMTRNAVSTPLFDILAPSMTWPCAALTVWSGIHYTFRGAQLGAHPQTEPNRAKDCSPPA